jgi:hypothetical protein
MTLEPLGRAARRDAASSAAPVLPDTDAACVLASHPPSAPQRRRATVNRVLAPRRALVEPGFDGTPRVVNRQAVALVREEWHVVDRWWTEEPVRRRYFEVVLESGQNTVVFRDEESGGWFSQRGA